MSRFAIFALVGVLFIGALGRGSFDRRVDATLLPPLTSEVGAEVLARDGSLLRAYTVSDGRWRMGVAARDVDTEFVKMLVGFEDKRFYRHLGVDPYAKVRALRQALWKGHIFSGGSTLTMQVARLFEEGGTGRWRGKLRQIRLAPCAGTAVVQGGDTDALSEPRALWREYRRYSCRDPRLFRKGPAPPAPR